MVDTEVPRPGPLVAAEVERLGGLQRCTRRVWVGALGRVSAPSVGAALAG